MLARSADRDAVEPESTIYPPANRIVPPKLANGGTQDAGFCGYIGPTTWRGSKELTGIRLSGLKTPGKMGCLYSLRKLLGRGAAF